MAKTSVNLTVDRPQMPKQYRLPKDRKGLLPWSHVDQRMKEAMRYWICTVTPDGRPHATPVDGLWLDDSLYFGGSPETRWRQNLSANPAVSIHLENALEVVILRGKGGVLTELDPVLAQTLSKASKDKYGFALSPKDYEKSGICVFHPQIVLAWQHFPKDATRWRFS
jgi:hypothetical protein